MPTVGDYQIIDAHIHLVRDTEQEKVVFPRRGWPDSWYWCSPGKIGPYMAQAGATHVVALNILATVRMIEQRMAKLPKGTPEKEAVAARQTAKVEMQDRVRKFNDWICDTHKKDPRIIPFVLVDPVLFGPDSLKELERSVARGAMGAKLHPRNCRHMPDHRDLMPVYEYCQRTSLPVLTDTNPYGGKGAEDENGVPYGWPSHWGPILSNFPKLRFIMAHFCDMQWDEKEELARRFKDNLWFDMSGGWTDEHHPPHTHGCMPADQVVRAFRRVGVERMFFGADAPGAGMSILQAASQIVGQPFTEQEKRMILGENAKRFFGLT